MRIAAWWKTTSIPRISSRTSSRSQMSPSTMRTGPCSQRPRQVVAAAADEVVEHDDLLGPGAHDLVREVRPDGAGAAGDEHAPATHVWILRQVARSLAHLDHQRAASRIACGASSSRVVAEPSLDCIGKLGGRGVDRSAETVDRHAPGELAVESEALAGTAEPIVDDQGVGQQHERVRGRFEKLDPSPHPPFQQAHCAQRSRRSRTPAGGHPGLAPECRDGHPDRRRGDAAVGRQREGQVRRARVRPHGPIVPVQRQHLVAHQRVAALQEFRRQGAPAPARRCDERDHTPAQLDRGCAQRLEPVQQADRAQHGIQQDVQPGRRGRVRRAAPLGGRAHESAILPPVHRCAAVAEQVRAARPALDREALAVRQPRR